MKKIPLVILGCILLLYTSHSMLFAADYEYEVSGHGDGGYVSGEIEANRGSRDVEGYLLTEDGKEVYFTGEWVGHGEIEGYDEEGNHYELEIK
jgi:hypothetical protein